MIYVDVCSGLVFCFLFSGERYEAGGARAARRRPGHRVHAPQHVRVVGAGGVAAAAHGRGWGAYTRSLVIQSTLKPF